MNLGGTNFDILVGLTSGTSSTGTMTINHENLDSDPIQGTFFSEFDVFFTATFVSTDGGAAIPCPAASCNFEKNFTSSGNWSHTFQGGTQVVGPPETDQVANIHTIPQSGFDDFFLVGAIIHDTGGGQHIIAHTIPEPSTILGTLVALGIGGFCGKRYDKTQGVPFGKS